MVDVYATPVSALDRDRLSCKLLHIRYVVAYGFQCRGFRGNKCAVIVQRQAQVIRNFICYEARYFDRTEKIYAQ